MSVLEFHPLANVLPLLKGAEFDRLVTDIAEQGLLNPITLYEDKVLDGRNRERACHAAKVKPRYTEYTGNDPAGFVLSQNLARRHLGPSERAMVAARMANLKWGQRADRVEGPIGLSTVAGLCNVSERHIKRATVVLKHGTPGLVQAVEQGRVAVHEAAKAAQQSPEAQADFLEAAAAGKSYMVWSVGHNRKQLVDALAQTTKALPVGEKRWPIIYADPPWRYEDPALATPNRALENHYPTMTLEEICALPVASLASDDALLFIWATGPKLEEAMQIIKAWGFEYRTCAVWDKEIIGTGYYFRNQHELLLVGKRGNIPHPAAGTQPSSVYRERRSEHSVKPTFFHDMIEKLYPDLPKIELFARQARPGWDAWGNEIPLRAPMASMK
jgi:N6-adenosine-specific RNA methylase IME4